jgi:peptide/nickel transport system ATP-binding protein
LGEDTREQVAGAPETQCKTEILAVRNLHVHFFTYAGVVKALNGFDLRVDRGEMTALVGESGSGKSVAAWSLLGLPKRPGKIVEGQVLWHGANVLEMSRDRLKRLRGQEISLILSNPRSHLHPLIKVGKQIQAVHMAHRRISKAEAREATLSVLEAIDLPDPKRIFDSYPHELSGGMAQRILIATALINSPELLIADDATNGLDVTIQRQVLDLMSDLIHEHSASALMITHDLGIVAQYCKWATIMYAGQTTEVTSVARLFQNPVHPYTQGLIGSIRSASVAARGKPLPGIAPDPMALPEGCYLEPRCPVRRPECKRVRPQLHQVEPDHWVRCVHYSDVGEVGSTKPGRKLAEVTAASVGADIHNTNGSVGEPAPVPPLGNGRSPVPQ